jgi:hypothetical protein
MRLLLAKILMKPSGIVNILMHKKKRLIKKISLFFIFSMIFYVHLRRS